MLFYNTTGETITIRSDETTNSQPLVSLSIEGLRIVQIVNHVVLSGTVCFLGIIVNIINMLIFVKQGLSDTVNLSLFAISLSDLCSLVTLEWLNMNLNPFMDKADVPFEPVEIQYFTGGWPHACFARITIWITIYVTAERFCCIAFPLKVKEIITPLKTKVIICVIYVLMFASLTPEYATMYFGEKFFPARNQTRIGLIDRSLKASVETFVFLLYAVIGCVSFAILILFTVLLIVNLQRRSDWRKKSTFNTEQSNTISGRDKKTMKMVSLISIILIVCFTPAIILYVTVFIVPGFGLTGIYANIFHTTWSIVFVAESINSSVNIILFYKMSSKYRRTFHQLFARCGVPCGRNNSRHISSMENRGASLTSSSSNEAMGTSTQNSQTNLGTELPM